MKNPDIISAVKPVIDVFNKLGIHYYIGGSVASSTYGLARSTLDVDIVSDIKSENVSKLVKILEASYYIDEEMILDAIQRRSSFNLIHLETMLKVDVFVAKEGLYHKKAFERRRKDTLDEEDSKAVFYIVSPEDIILSKLDWYRLGGGVSERQWNDVMGVLKVQRDLLDMKYLQHWASELGLADLLERVLTDARID